MVYEPPTDRLKPVTAEVLRLHFIQTYKLTEEQSDGMVVSAVCSLEETFKRGHAALAEDNREKIANFAHSLKGLLLNMGQLDWAEKARFLETAARENRSCTYQEMIAELYGGIQILIEGGQGG